MHVHQNRDKRNNLKKIQRYIAVVSAYFWIKQWRNARVWWVWHEDALSFLISPFYFVDMISISEANNVDASGSSEIDASLPKHILGHAGVRIPSWLQAAAARRHGWSSDLEWRPSPLPHHLWHRRHLELARAVVAPFFFYQELARLSSCTSDATHTPHLLFKGLTTERTSHF